MSRQWMPQQVLWTNLSSGLTAAPMDASVTVGPYTQDVTNYATNPAMRATSSLVTATNRFPDPAFSGGAAKWSMSGGTVVNGTDGGIKMTTTTVGYAIATNSTVQMTGLTGGSKLYITADVRGTGTATLAVQFMQVDANGVNLGNASVYNGMAPTADWSRQVFYVTLNAATVKSGNFQLIRSSGNSAIGDVTEWKNIKVSLDSDPTFFDGDTPADGTHTYQWVATVNASASQQIVQQVVEWDSSVLSTDAGVVMTKDMATITVAAPDGTPVTVASSAGDLISTVQGGSATIGSAVGTVLQNVMVGDAPYFDGDTLADGTFTYSWSGTPNQSVSVRSDSSSWTRLTSTTADHGVRLDLTDRLTQIPAGTQTINDGDTVTASWEVWNDGSAPLEISADWADVAPVAQTLAAGEVVRIYRTGSRSDYTGFIYADLVPTSASSNLLFRNPMIVPGIYTGVYFDGDTPDTGASEDDLRYSWTGTPGASPSIQYLGGVWLPQWVTGYQPVVPLHNYRQVEPPAPKFKDSFGVEISYGAAWIDLNDHLNYVTSPENFGTKAQTLRRTTATSPYYDGTFLVHSTKENITEGLVVWVYGVSQNNVTENLLQLEELFSQPAYSIRVRMDDHMETWTCQPSDYSIERSHVYMHNVMAAFKAQIPRMPRVLYEAVF